MATPFDKSTVTCMLADLKCKDPGFKVFGSTVHRYELNPPLPIQQIQEFEAKYGVKLPEDYREFITEIGNGGAGPYYGVFRFGEHDDFRDFQSWEGGYLVGDLSAEFQHQMEWNLPTSFWAKLPDPGPSTPIEEEDRMMEEWDKELNEHYWNPKIMNGAIPICHLGCAIRHWLVINGPQKGFVWADERVDDLGISPLRSDSKQMTFSDWYMSWLRSPLIV
ncbi:MAG: SMI1/KNR4 family protein [Zavarzinella sp.]